MGYYKQGCQTALSVAGVSQPPTYGVGSREGITLERQGWRGTYLYRGRRGDYGVNSMMPDGWEVRGPDFEQMVPTLRDARKLIVRAEVGSREGITLSRIQPGLYHYGDFSIHRVHDIQKGNWALFRKNKLYRHFDTLRDGRKWLVENLWPVLR